MVATRSCEPLGHQEQKEAPVNSIRPAGAGSTLPRAARALGPCTAALGLSLLALPALAQETRQDSVQAVTPEGPRYAFAPVEGGALKLDTQTGKVSLCAKGPTGYTCEAVPDSRDAYEAEIARLQREIATLKGPKAPDAGTGTAPGASSDLDQALDYADRIYRRFRSMIEDFTSGSGERI